MSILMHRRRELPGKFWKNMVHVLSAWKVKHLQGKTYIFFAMEIPITGKIANR